MSPQPLRAFLEPQTCHSSNTYCRKRILARCVMVKKTAPELSCWHTSEQTTASLCIDYSSVGRSPALHCRHGRRLTFPSPEARRQLQGIPDIILGSHKTERVCHRRRLSIRQPAPARCDMDFAYTTFRMHYIPEMHSLLTCNIVARRPHLLPRQVTNMSLLSLIIIT